MEGTRLIVALGVFCCLLLTANFVLVIVLVSKSNNTTTIQQSEEETESTQLINIFGFEDYAKRTLERSIWWYMKYGAATEYTLRDNQAAFNRYKFSPQMMKGVADANITTSILGQVVSCPIGFSPVAFQKWAHPEGESATVRAARKLRVVAAFSDSSTVKIEDLAEVAPSAIRWQQIVLYGLPELTIELVRRAERSGFSAIVVTIDRPGSPITYPPGDLNFIWPPGATHANFNSSPEFLAKLPNPGQNWEEFRWLRNQTQLPIVVKGVLRAADAKMAIKSGADAIWVSNHGGRVLDGVPATIDVLSEVVAAVNGSVEVYMDGGIRTGMDVAKAIALGARAVFIGRPVWYGLAHSGQEGVEKVLDILQKEFFSVMQFLGADRPSKLDPSVIIKPPSSACMKCYT